MFLSSTSTSSSLLVGDSHRASRFGALPSADVDLVSVVDADAARMASSCLSNFASIFSLNLSYLILSLRRASLRASARETSRMSLSSSSVSWCIEMSGMFCGMLLFGNMLWIGGKAVRNR